MADILNDLSQLTPNIDSELPTTLKYAKGSDFSKLKKSTPVKELLTTNIPFVAKFAYKDFHEGEDDKYEKMDTETSMQVLNQFPMLSEEEKLELYKNSNNYTQMYNNARFRSKILEDAQAVTDYYGDYAIVANIATSLLNPVDYVYGGVFGKVAKTAVTAGKVASRTGQRTIEATGAVATGLASVGTLEATTGGSMSMEQGAITAGTGALIGFALARKYGIDKADSIEDAIKVNDTQMRIINDIDTPVLKNIGDAPVTSLNNTPDMNLRYSKNNDIAQRNIEADIGSKLSHDVQAQTSNVQDTVKDVKTSLLHKNTHSSTLEYDNAIKEFKQTTGRNYDATVEAEIDTIGGTIDHTLTRSKQAKKKELEELYREEMDAKIQAIKDTLSSEGKETTKKALKKNKEIQAIKDEYDMKIRKEVLLHSKNKIDELLETVPQQYRKFIDIVRKHNTAYAKELNSTKYNGKDMLDESFYWRKDLDLHKIRNNPELASQRFAEAIADNFNPEELTDDVIAKINEKAKNMITKLLDDDVNRLDNLDIDREVFRDDLIQSMNVSALKDRKMTYNAGKLTEFMKSGIIDRMNQYGRDVSSKIALKKVFDIDDNFTATQFANKNKLTGDARKSFDEAMKGVYDKRLFNPDSGKTLSRIVDTFQNINYATLGGWFGVQTMLDLATMVNKFGFGKTAKYATSPLFKALDNESKEVREAVAHYYGLGVESVLSSRSSLMGVEFNPYGRTVIEEGSRKFANLTSKLSGLNMAVDFVDRTTGLLALDFVQSAKLTPKVLKQFNILGLTADDINLIRQSGAIGYNGKFVTGFKPELLDDVLRDKLDRGVLRSVNDVILKGDDMDLPEWFTTVCKSPAVVKVLLPFMRFPLVAYNRIQRDVYHNFDAMNFSLAMVTATALGSILAMSKEVGKSEENKKYGFDTEERTIETLMFTIDRNPLFTSVGTINQYTDILGQTKSLLTGEEYKDKLEGKQFGITLNRIDRMDDVARNFLGGNMSANDSIFLKSMVVPNYAWASPFNNAINEEIKENE